MERDALEAESIRARQYIRDDWIRRQMTSLETEFTSVRNMRVFVGTYNVNGKKPSEALFPWLCSPLEPLMAQGAALPDFYVVGFQEIVDLNVQNAVTDANTRERSAQWQQLIQETINALAMKAAASNNQHTPDRYGLLDMKYLVGIMVCVSVLDRHRPHVHSVQATTAATGIMGVVGNKGGASIRVQVYDSSICFVCAHLAAHRENVEGRNNDYRTINDKTSFRYDAGPSGRRQQVPERHHPRVAAHTLDAMARGTLGILEHDHVVWLGDFNYRIDATHSTETVFAHVKKGDVAWLQHNDQLNIERSAGRVFEGFEEAPLAFLPTYKYQVGTDLYEERPEKKLRAPAWCDRVLYLAEAEPPAAAQGMPGVQVVLYDRVVQLRGSDHKPVVAVLDMRVRALVDEKRNDAYERVLRRLDAWENAYIPTVTLSSTSVSVAPEGVVYYRTEASQVFTIANNGKVPAAWRFVRRPDGSLTKPWVSVDPLFGMLIPGESIDVRVTLFVGVSSARLALEASRVLDDVLILRVEGGSDHFVSVSGTLAPTCFGADLVALCHAPWPMRANAAEREAVVAARQGDHSPLPVPKELWNLLDYLWRNGGLEQYNLFLEPGVPEEMRVVRECLDTGVGIPPPDEGTMSLHSVAATAIELLDSLAEPLVPSALFPNVDFDSVAAQGWTSRFLRQLPTPNHNVFLFVMLFLRELVSGKHAQLNRLTPRKLAPVFARALLHPTLAAETMRQEKSANASGVGEFASWLLGDGSNKGGNAIATSEKAVQLFIETDPRAWQF